MKTSFNLLIIIFLCKSLTAQKITYQPVFINPCTFEEASPYVLLLDSQNNIVSDIDYKNINLQDTGQYKLVYHIFPKRIINITSRGITRDTFFMPSLVETGIVTSPPTPLKYYHCEQLAEGKIIDYYYNGKIRTSGTFKKGEPIDTIKRYYHSGQLEEVYIPYKDNFHSIEYRSNGNLKTDYNTQKRYRMEYDSSGRLAKYQKLKGNYITKLYYENGVVKEEETTKKLLRYSEQGKLTDKITRRKVIDFDKDFDYYKYKWISFDGKGEKKRVILFELYDDFEFHFPESLKQIFTRNIERILFYKNKKKTHKIEFNYIDYNTQNAILYQKINDVWKEIDSKNNKEFVALIEQLKPQ